MDAYPPPFAPPNAPVDRRPQHRHSADFRAPGQNGAMPAPNGNAPLPVPHGRMTNGRNDGRRMSAVPGFEGPRSPPNSKNTSHVPCKFFRQGACQAGKACPFLHSTDPVVETPCKYFQKGNCKFGAKCALAHILPDGRRVNRPNYGGGPLHLGGRMNVHRGSEAPPGGSLLSMQAHMAPQHSPTFPYPPQDEMFPQQLPPTSKPHYDMPTIDTTFSSHPGSAYGSPPNDSRLGISPGQKGLSVLDAPLPASFDSQGISHIARYGPIAASVPGRLGIESSSPPSSLPHRALNESAVRNLHNSAFGTDNRMQNNGLGSSPPVATEEAFGRRIMHSERYTKQKLMSASLPRGGMAGDEWDENFAFEEDLVPNSLHELLTPQEKMRRFSRADEDTSSNILSHRLSMSGLGTPRESSSKVGSPAASSPSRFSAIFARTSSKQVDAPVDPAPGGASAFGHVGSPLRNSSLHPNASPSLRAVSRPVSGDVSPFVGVSSPPRQASMSMITQQLQRTKLANRASSEGNLEPASHPGVSRMASGSSVGSAPGSGNPTPGRMDRVASGASTVGVGRDRIEEETAEQGLFSMEDEEQLRERKSAQPTNGKRTSGAWGFTVGSGKAGFGPIGGQRNGTPTAKENGWGHGTG